MIAYEYIRLKVDFEVLSELNSLSRVGWKVVAVVPDAGTAVHAYWALLERPTGTVSLEDELAEVESHGRAEAGANGD